MRTQIYMGGQIATTTIKHNVALSTEIEDESNSMSTALPNINRNICAPGTLNKNNQIIKIHKRNPSK